MPEKPVKIYIYIIFKTPLGWMGIVKSRLGLHTVILPRRSDEGVKECLKRCFSVDMVREEKGFKSIQEKIINYVSGKTVTFNEPLDFSEATDFERRVWLLVSTIPRGQVRSYDWVAKSLGEPKARRAVGRALSRNRLPIIVPCHRVIQKDGTLGGYSAGINLKRTLLSIEGRVW